jgi:hypothetical protein
LVDRLFVCFTNPTCALVKFINPFFIVKKYRIELI